MTSTRLTRVALTDFFVSMKCQYCWSGIWCENWIREWDKLKPETSILEKQNKTKQLGFFCWGNPRKSPCFRLFRAGPMIKMNTIFGAGTFPKSLKGQACLLFRTPQRRLELIVTPGKDWVGHAKDLMYITNFIPSRVLIFKTRSNHIIRKHNSVLRCYILGCKIFINWFVHVLCRGSWRGTCQRTTYGSWFSVPLCGSWRASSGPQVDGKCHSPTEPSCWSLRWGSIRTFQPQHHQTAVLYSVSKPHCAAWPPWAWSEPRSWEYRWHICDLYSSLLWVGGWTELILLRKSTWKTQREEADSLSVLS